MKASTSKFIISLFFTSLLLIKVGVSVLSVFSADLNEPMTEMLMETEEKKEKSKAEASIEEELFGKALLPGENIFLANFTTSDPEAITEPLPGVYLDTLTPPPNAFI